MARRRNRCLEGKRVVLGVSGGIAAYKVADLASKLMQAGALVDVIMTEAAQKFVTPMTFSALTHRPVRTDIFESWLGEDTGHVGLAHNAAIWSLLPPPPTRLPAWPSASPMTSSARSISPRALRS